MPSDIVFALAALVAYGLGDVIYKRAALSGLSSQHFIMGQAWFFCPVVVVYAWASGRLAFTWPALWGAAAGLLLLTGFYNFFRALRTGAVSVIAPVFRLNFIVTAALAIGWLHEPLTPAKGLGFALSFAAGWLLLAAPSKGPVFNGDTVDPAAARGSFLRVIGATVATGAGAFCHKLGLVAGATPESLLSAQALAFCSTVTVMTYATLGTIRPPAGFARHSGPAAVVLVAAFLFLLYGLKGGQASIVVPIAQMGFVVAAVMGAALFHETWTARKLAGLAAAVAALVALAFG